MKLIVVAAAALAACAVSAVAVADPSAPEAGPGYLKMPTQVIVGRPNKPHVIVDVRPPTAAAAAGAAHEAMRASWYARQEPHQ
jgi:hypothetical protein